ncbi:MAG TPA: HD domain-containing protein [Bacteroidetes bacterium]|nr:HD domain-containing protein [Bacteroidota bacterium]
MALVQSEKNNQAIICQVFRLAKDFHSSDTTGHDWWHIFRVWNLAKYIADNEGADREIVEMAALLHDMDDHKIDGADWQNLPNARKVLESVGVNRELIDRVVAVIGEVSFKGANVDTKPTTNEACVVQDADRLDAIGAIGVARAFAYGGSKQRELYNPNEAPNMHATFEEYKNSKGCTLNHFYEKLFLLKEKLNTPTAKRIAVSRHRYMEVFVEQFLAEWNFEDESVHL